MTEKRSENQRTQSLGFRSREKNGKRLSRTFYIKKSLKTIYHEEKQNKDSF